ncbi:lipopolysaccharide core biosynthesis protein [mine drainage metagenome]|uniref:Lipopolysaccharide core biosynthesis protein n=1 Tax=mine drainage metagenome TaxID=410659 RepID=A0A1J5SFA2_9ZZZZ
MKVNCNKAILVFRSGLIGDNLVAIPALLKIREQNSSASISYISFKEKASHITPREVLGGIDGLIDNFFELRIYNYKLLFFDILKLSKFIIINSCRILYHLETYDFNVKKKRFFLKLLGVNKFYYQKENSNQKISNSLINIISKENLEQKLFDKPIMFNAKPFLSESIETKVKNLICSEHKGKIVVFAVCTNFKSKLWEAENFIYLIQKLNSNFSLIPVFLGSEQDFEYCERIKSQVGIGYNLAGKLTIQESLFFMDFANFYVGNDTGVMHMAAMRSLKCFAVFSAIEKSIKWFPHGNNHEIFKEKVECEGCRLRICVENNNLCTKLITKEKVWLSLSRYLNNIK